MNTISIMRFDLVQSAKTLSSRSIFSIPDVQKSTTQGSMAKFLRVIPLVDGLHIYGADVRVDGRAGKSNLHR